MNAIQVMLNDWAVYCLSTTGDILPLNMIEQDEGVFAIGYDCGDGVPVTCKDGRVVRRVLLGFPSLVDVTFH